MGTPIDPPPKDYSCALCWGSADGPFGFGPPPGQVTVFVEGVQKGSAWVPSNGEPPNGYHVFPQWDSCTWGTGVLVVTQFWSPDTAPYVLIRGTGGDSAFRGSFQPGCITEYTNYLTNPISVFYGGTAKVLF